MADEDITELKVAYSDIEMFLKEANEIRKRWNDLAQAGGLRALSVGAKIVEDRGFTFIDSVSVTVSMDQND